ncbi:NAD(P)-binding protein [Setomelanomma holmii]|uniref:NAD(P)-binding protein n=1 Tax=Setomelanomma holmii TaxID=210430 RepID=A0A9P4LS08_9PLEO|nr:NAD(P)-binding protein [Setomelanomma holmii]
MSKPVAIVTGAGSGIGEGVATHLYSKGYKVVVADLNPTTGEKVAARLGLDATFIQADVASYRSQALLFKQAYEWGGNRLDFFHANAGIDDRQVIYDSAEKEEVDEEGLLKPLNTKTMQVNLEAVIQGLWLFKYYVRKSKEAGGGKGKFVATSSAAGLYAMPQCPQYTASKYGVVGLVRASGEVFVKEGITVNAICPAFIPTNLCPPEVLKRWPKEHITPLSTVNKAIDAFLADDTLTGQAVELSQGDIFFRQQVDWPNESQKWVGTQSHTIWDEGYAVGMQPMKRIGD